MKNLTLNCSDRLSTSDQNNTALCLNEKLVPLFIILLALLLAGCSVHSPMTNVVTVDVPASYSQPADKAELTGLWWSAFNDSTLNSLIDDAFRNNLDISAAYERLQQSVAAAEITGSARGINLNIEGSGGRSRQSGTLGILRKDTYSLSAAAAYEIDLWGKLKSSEKAAEFEALASEEDLKALYISISAQLADLYYLAVEQRAQLDLSDQTIESFQDTLNRIERRYNEGLSQALDVYQARENLASAKARRPLSESSLAVTLNSISILLGHYPDGNTGGNVRSLAEPPSFPTGIPSELLSNRPDIKASYYRLEAKDKRVAAAIADRFPSFNLVGTYGGSSDKVRTVLDSPNIFWNILLQAAQPVLDAGRRKSEVDRSKAAFRESLALYHKTVLNAFKEIEDALAKGNSTEKRIKMLNEVVTASENALELATDNYMAGLTDYLPVLTEQLRHFTAKSNLLAAKRQLISDRIQLVRSLGGEWTEKALRGYKLQTKN